MTAVGSNRAGCASRDVVRFLGEPGTFVVAGRVFRRVDAGAMAVERVAVAGRQMTDRETQPVLREESAPPGGVHQPDGNGAGVLLWMDASERGLSVAIRVISALMVSITPGGFPWGQSREAR